MENVPDKFAHIPGWGIDADPENDPTYPMKKRTNDEHNGYSWDRPTQQTDDDEILHSIERPNLSATYGTSTQLSGLSGMIRRYAYRYSESSYNHWLPLMLADRVDMVEGIVDDLTEGHVPNIFAERGWKAEWEHNRPALMTKVAIGVVATAALMAYMRRDDHNPRRR